MEERSVDIVIIGGGAAGMAAAIGAGHAASGTGLKTAVLEKMPRPGRKIIITGKGRCNLTNLKEWNDFSTHIHPKPNFLKNAFYNFSSRKLVDFCNANGLETVTERGDRVFPASYSSKDVVDFLYSCAEKSGAEMMTGCEVTGISRDETGHYLVMLQSGMSFNCRKLIIATGGLSYPATGSTGDGYGWAEALGHRISRCFPSLTAIVPKNYKTGNGTKGMKGYIERSTPLSETGELLKGNQLKNVELTLVIDGNEAMEEFGDVDFTDGGLEGPLGFKISRKCVNALINGSKVSVSLDMKPAVSLEELDKRIQSLWQEISNDRRSRGKMYRDRFRVLLSKVLPRTLVQGFSRCNPDADHKTLARCLKNWKFDISGYVGYERCVITAGGIATDEVSAKTMESKKSAGLYFAGEILDIDADTGGYNLQTAFSTGMLAGESAAKSIIG